MAKWSGKVGYNVGSYESAPGVWFKDIVERPHRGDLLRNSKSNNMSGELEGGSKVNPDISLASNTISIVVDAFMMDNFMDIVWITLHGYKWTVTSVSVERPRLTVNLGGLYAHQGPEVKPIR